MPENTNVFSGGLAGEASHLSERLVSSAERMQSKVSDMGRHAVNQIDENREAAASGLRKVATVIQEKGEKVSGMAHATADKLSSTADYVREHNVNSMMADVKALVRNNPGPSLVAVAVAGFLVGRTFSSRRA